MPGNPAGAFGVRCLLVDGPLLEPFSGGISEEQFAKRAALDGEQRLDQWPDTVEVQVQDRQAQSFDFSVKHGGNRDAWWLVRD